MSALPLTTVTVCVGSSCHVKGARDVIERFIKLLKDRGLEERIALEGSFCMERCGEGVNWRIGEELITSASADEAVEELEKRLVELLSRDPCGGPR